MQLYSIILLWGSSHVILYVLVDSDRLSLFPVILVQVGPDTCTFIYFWASHRGWDQDQCHIARGFLPRQALYFDGSDTLSPLLVIMVQVGADTCVLFCFWLLTQDGFRPFSQLVQ